MSIIQKSILLLLTGLSLISYEIAAQRNKPVNLSLADQIILVSNFSDLNNHLEKEVLSFDQLLKNKVRGFIIRLILDTDSARVKMVIPNREIISLSATLSGLQKFLNNNPGEVITLFLDYNFPFFYLESEFKNNQLFNRIFVLGDDGNWPVTNNMALKGHQLICFNIQRNQDSPPGFYHIWDYAVEPHFSVAIDPEFHGSFLKGKPSNPFMFFNGFNLPRDTAGMEMPFLKMHINENPFLISHLINLWKKTGKKPNFIVRNQYHPVIEGIIFNLNSHKSIGGNVTYNLQPLSNVSWQGTNHGFSSGHYSFPFLAGEDVFLTPVKPGFRFIPEKISIENVENNIIQNFIALPLDLNHNLAAYYPFENNFKDMGSAKNNGQNNGVTFVNDPERGYVACFKDETFLKIASAEELGIYNNDFTVSAWIKTVEPPFERGDVSILGSEEAIYRQGLHLQLRNSKPYFGFYANDLTGNSEISHNEWVHIVWRYTKNTGEQAIFINGRADKVSYKHPSFMGRSTIFVGKSIGMHNYMNGFIDDLAIWKRPLGNEEIWKLYQEVLPLIQPTSSQLTGYFFLLVLLPALIFFGYIIWIKFIRIRFQKNNKQIQYLQVTYNEKNIPDSNCIRLFGEFQVFDRDGNDISAQFTPKVRQLFIVILLYSIKSRRGVSSDEINQMLWFGHTKKNATNNRGVNMSKLRQVLQLFDGIRVDNQTENWSFSMNRNVLFCDYCEVQSLLKNKSLMTNQAILANFFSLVERGPLLMDSEEPWLDEFKGFMSSEVIDTLLKYSTYLKPDNESETILRICDRIFLSDPFSEEALEIKILTLLKNNQANQAKYTYQWFCENYEKAFDIQYNRPFDQFAEKQDNKN